MGLNDGAEDAALAEKQGAATSFDVEDEEAAVNFDEASGSADFGALGRRFQMIDFDARADGNRSSGKAGADGESGGGFHHGDHGGRRENGRERGIVVGDRPFMRDDAREDFREAGPEHGFSD